MELRHYRYFVAVAEDSISAKRPNGSTSPSQHSVFKYGNWKKTWEEPCSITPSVPSP